MFNLGQAGLSFTRLLASQKDPVQSLVFSSPPAAFAALLLFRDRRIGWTALHRFSLKLPTTAD